MRTHPIRVYADTSVFGGVFDEEFAKASRMFFDEVRQGRFSLVTSVAVRDEVEPGPPHVRAFFQEMVPLAEVIQVPDAAFDLQSAYVEHGALSARWAADALHVALASVAGCSILVSWNYRHIVNFRRIAAYNAVNALQGYKPIRIHSPVEVVHHEEEDV